jgi:RimJ/RimL family protein N-acetyltransferase
MMTDELFRGNLVRLTAEEPDAMAKAMPVWNLDSEYYRMLDGSPQILWSEKKVKEWLEKDLDRDPAQDLFFGMRTLAEDKLIGFMSLFDLAWNQGEAIVAIAIGERAYWNKGYGTDAMRVMLRYVFDELNLRRLTLIVFEHNPRGLRSYQKAGFVVEGRIRGAMLREGRRWDWFYMGILREEWEARNEQEKK